MNLGEATWTELDTIVGSGILLVPLGSTEQHGPHLPLATDTTIAVAVCEGAAARRSGLFVAPALAYGSSGEHAAFPGTLSIGQAALELVAIELARSADAFGGVVLVSGHGGNAAPLTRAVEVLVGEGRRAAAWFPSGSIDAHAGRSETSLMLRLRPELVRQDRAEAGDIRPLGEILPMLETDGVAAVSSNGVLGDPAGASAAEGRVALDDLVRSLIDVIDTLGSRG